MKIFIRISLVICCTTLIGLSCKKNFTIDNKSSIEQNNTEIIKFTNGDIKAIISKKNGIKNGKVKWYFQNGNLEYESFYHNGKPISSEIFYYENGEPKTYNFYDGFGTAIFQRKYSNDGKILSNSGKPAIIISDENWKNYSAGEIFNLSLICATPPNSTTYVKFENEDSPPFIIYDDILKIDSIDVIPIEVTFTNPGIEKLVVIGTIEDTIRNNIFTDTMKYKLNVKS